MPERGRSLYRVALVGLALLACSAPRISSRADLNRAQRVTDGPYAEAAPMCSPDAKWLTFEYFDPKHASTPEIWIMPRLGNFDSARPLTDPSFYGGDASWSPDSRWIAAVMGFPLAGQDGPQTNNEQVVKINVQSREVVKLTHFAPNTTIDPTTAWLQTGWIVFSAVDDNIYGVPDDGGEPRKLVDVPSGQCPDNGTNTLAGSPDGRRIAFDMLTFNAKCDALWVADIDTGKLRRVPTGVHPVNPFWLDGNDLLFSGETDDEKPEGIYRVSLRTGKVTRLLKGLYLTPFVCGSGKMLYFSSGPRLETEGGSWNFFHGFHVWRMPMQALDP
jgi:dipeptidyl aminopeptidase/acylaminoacyl peptidase